MTDTRTDSPELSAEELRLHLGEMTPREVEVARAAIRYARADLAPAVREAVNDALLAAAQAIAELRNRHEPGPVFGAYNSAIGVVEDIRFRPAALESAPGPELHHYSGCAVHNAPAYEPGPCDCGGYIPAPEREGLDPRLKEAMDGVIHFGDAVAYRDDPLSKSLRGWIAEMTAALAAYEEGQK